MEAEATDVHRADLVGRWHAGESCDSSLVLDRQGSARFAHWAKNFSVDESRITSWEDGRGSWTLDTLGGSQVLNVETSAGGEQLSLLRSDHGGLILLQIPGDDPDNSIGCRFRRVKGQ
ncbi:hypothetical protein [Streptomyces sp. NPDC088785]|uniref:hypothetical protein n=1 Tax=Streptomyces sp. NPDC088785 TaxID=3365897 RepID=UPI0038065160